MKFNSLVPEIKVTDIKNSLDFYTKIIGFKVEYERPESKFAFLSFQGSQMMIEQMNDDWKTEEPEYPFGRGVHFQIKVRDLNPLLKSLKKNRYEIFVKLHEKWYRKGKKLLGQRQFLVKDPDGYLLRFFESIGVKVK